MNLSKFSQINLERCTSPDGFGHSLQDWSEAEWTNAIEGELGETLQVLVLAQIAAGSAANLTKKLLRHRDGVAGNRKPEDLDVPYLKERVVKEISDIMIYSDLAIQRLGFDTSEIITKVFNAKSDELGCPIRYEEMEEE